MPAAVIGILPERDMDTDFVDLLERTNAAVAACNVPLLTASA